MTATKRSGIAWLGEVPSHWEVKRLKQIVQWARPITYGIVQAGPKLDEGIPYIRPMDMTDEGIPNADDLPKTSHEIASAYTRSEVREGDLVVTIGPSYGKIAFVPKGLDGANLTQGTARVAVDTELASPGFLAWLLRSKEVHSYWGSSSSGATFTALNLEPLSETPITVPPLPEQNSIAAFLDERTARIDALVARKRRLVQLLKEKRQALITRAVTRGLDPEVKMKESGVPWLGEVPEHWALPALNSRYEILLGKMLDEKRLTKTALVPYLRNIDVQWDRVNTEDLHEMDIAPSEYERFSLSPGDLLVCEGGDIGRTATWRGEMALCAYQKAVHRVRPRSVAEHPRYLFYTMVAVHGRGVFLAEGNPNTIPHLTGEKFRRYRFPQPPYQEQVAIADYLDRMTPKMDDLVTKVEQAVERLQEYRAALISAAVTGKVRVG